MTAQPSSQAEREDVALLPCPFCGAAAIWCEDDPARPYDPIGLIVDHARDCFLRGVVNFDKASITGTWNTRSDREHATPRSMPEEVVEAYRHHVHVDDSLAFADQISEGHRLRANAAEARFRLIIDTLIDKGESWQSYADRLRAIAWGNQA